ncbi:MAG: hypothetical protein ACI4IV_02925 [Acutalibacteraceae bacterium]
MMVNNTLSKYVDAITAEARQAEEEAKAAIAEYKEDQLARFKASAEEASRSEISRRTAVISQDIGRDFSAKEIALRSQIFTKREEIKNAVFSAAAGRLREFTETDEYEQFVVSSAREIKKNLIGRDKVITVYLRECDLRLKSAIEEAFGFPCDFVIDNTIKIGGIKAKFSRVVLDDTLDSRLSSNLDWFEENSALDIK